VVAAQSHKRTKVFISYSHQDGEWLRRLRVHLRPLERCHQIEIWDDTRIKAGSKWKEEIEQALATTKVAVLLVSADFLASDFIALGELPPLLQAVEKEGAIILPVILSPSRFLRIASLSQFQAVNDPAKPLIGMSKSEQESVLVKVTEDIEAALNHSSKIMPEGPHSYESRNSDTRTERSSKHTKLPKIHPTIWVAIISSLVALLIGYWQFVYKPFISNSEGTVQYVGRVTDQVSEQAIRGAKVSVEAQSVPQDYYTDSNGVFYVKLRRSIDTIRLRVEANGYEPFDKNVSLNRTSIEDVRLKPSNTTPTPSPSITPNTNLTENVNKILEDKKPSRRRPNDTNMSDLESRKKRARDDLNYRSPTPEP
jgi:hypothetical protein